MESFVKWTVAATGIFLVSFALMMKTENAKSSIVFKVIPFLLGMACIFDALVLFGII